MQRSITLHGFGLSRASFSGISSIVSYHHPPSQNNDLSSSNSSPKLDGRGVTISASFGSQVLDAALTTNQAALQGYNNNGIGVLIGGGGK